jgi:trimeric autotransporter adhesin
LLTAQIVEGADALLSLNVGQAPNGSSEDALHDRQSKAHEGHESQRVDESDEVEVAEEGLEPSERSVVVASSRDEEASEDEGFWIDEEDKDSDASSRSLVEAIWGDISSDSDSDGDREFHASSDSNSESDSDGEGSGSLHSDSFSPSDSDSLSLSEEEQRLV